MEIVLLRIGFISHICKYVGFYLKVIAIFCTKKERRKNMKHNL